MEDVLEIYHKPHDPDFPLVCLDETSKQLIAETRLPIPAKPGMPARHDYEYARNGTANLFMLFAPPLACRLPLWWSVNRWPNRPVLASWLPVIHRHSGTRSQTGASFRRSGMSRFEIAVAQQDHCGGPVLLNGREQRIYSK